jgi:hypothetical protein
LLAGNWLRWPEKGHFGPAFFCLWDGKLMRSFWLNPYLWVHLAGLAAVPLWLGIVWLGLAVGDPWLPTGLELGLVAAGSAPIIWMQWQRPFNIFSLLVVTLKPDRLTPDQCRILTLMQARKNPLVIGLGSLGLWLGLGWLYDTAAIVTDFAPFPPNARGLGLILAAVAFLASNLFLQVPLSVLQVLWVSEATFSATNPYPVEKISSTFTQIGWPVNQILPDLLPDPPLPPAASPRPDDQTDPIARLDA